MVGRYIGGNSHDVSYFPSLAGPHKLHVFSLGILDGEPYDSPIQEGILLTCMIEMLPYVDSDKSEFSEEVFEEFLRDLADEINEEERGEEPPKGESERHILLQLQQSMGQVVGQLKELQSSVKEISRIWSATS